MRQKLHTCRVQVGVLLPLVLLLFGCGGTIPVQPSGLGADAPDGSMNAPTGLNNPDMPVSGQEGQLGEPALSAGVQGQVTDAAGKPLPEVLVTPQSTDNPPQGVPELAVVTDNQGRYQWTLAPGAYTLTFTRDGYALATQAIVVKANQLATADIRLNPQ